ncbi:MAG TPA: hypothetical protein VHH11_13810 [Gammaproteobacteria bacterium]|nr:hypothetical protein [Gammaproteobacteria bacterium]
MNATDLLTPPQLAAVLHVLAWAAVAGFVLRLVGRAFGPFVQRRFPRAYGPLADFGGALIALLTDLVSAAARLRNGARTSLRPPPRDADADADARITPDVRGRGHDGFASRRALTLAALVAFVLAHLTLVVMLSAGTAGCGASGPQLHAAPVVGSYRSDQWGRCVVGGVRVSSVGSALVTAHGCVRLDLPDAAVVEFPPLDAGASAP